MLHRNYMLIILILFAKTTFAGQIVSLSNNGEGNAQIARTALNRIYIEEDKIVNIVSINGELMIQKDLDNGQLFVKPFDEKREKPIEIFISTEAGKHVALSLKPLTIKSQNIGLSLQKKNVDDENELKMLALIKQLKDVEVLSKRIQRRNIGKNERRSSKKIEVSRTITLKQGEFKGEVYEVINRDRKSLEIDLKPYWDKDVKAVAAEKDTLSIGEATKIYVVKSYA